MATIQEIANLMLLRGNLGAPGAGLCPVRGHSNVQGDRTMGINERPPVALLDALERRFSFKVPRHNGHNTVEAIGAMLAGQAKVFIGLGGNFAQATPDTERSAQALRSCELTVQISTKLNRSHLIHGKQALILPCLGRTDIDLQSEGPQAVTVEDSFSMVHASNGQLQPLSRQMRSEPAVIAGIAAATLGAKPVDWNWLVADYGRIRDLIGDTIPGFDNFNQRLEHPGGFYLGNSAGQRQWKTASGRANFKANGLPDDLLHECVRATGQVPDLIMQSMRSHDQYNTTIYGLDDRYRGSRASATSSSPTRPTSSVWAFTQGRRPISCRSGAMAANVGSRVSPCWLSTSRRVRRRRIIRKSIRWYRWKASVTAVTPRPRSSSRSNCWPPATTPASCDSILCSRTKKGPGSDAGALSQVSSDSVKSRKFHS